MESKSHARQLFTEFWYSNILNHKHLKPQRIVAWLYTLEPEKDHVILVHTLWHYLKAFPINSQECCGVCMYGVERGV